MSNEVQVNKDEFINWFMLEGPKIAYVLQQTLNKLTNIYCYECGCGCRECHTTEDGAQNACDWETDLSSCEHKNTIFKRDNKHE